MHYKHVLIWVLPFLLFACGGKNEDDSAAFRMNRINISESRLPEISGPMAFNPADSAAATEKWLAREMLYREALQKHLDKDESLRRNLENYQKDLLSNTFLEYYLSDKISISEEEIVNYYRDNRDSFHLRTDRARIVHYLFDNSDDANSSKRILLYGDPVQKNSLTERFLPEEKLVTRGMLIEVLDQALFVETRQAQVIGPINSEFGYHILDVKEFYPENSYLPVVEVRQLIRERMYQDKKDSAYRKLIKTLKEKYEIL